MKIEPGTRVRSTEEECPTLTEGAYVKWDGVYHVIDWDTWEDGVDRSGYLHLAGEFEVIDE